MTAMEKSGIERISFGKIPFLWKKKINSFLKETPDKAIATFFENLRLNNNPKQMIYGLEISLPKSLNYILTSFDRLNQDEFTHILELFSSTTFLENILKLDKAHQEKLLLGIAKFWPKTNSKITKNIIRQIDPSLSLLIYQMITPTTIELVDLLSIWVDQDVRVLYLLLDNYFKEPIDLAIPIFHQTSSDRLITACKSNNFPATISVSKIEIFLKLFTHSSEEIAFLFTGFSNSPKESQSFFIKWLINQPISITNLIISIPIKQTQKETTLIIACFNGLITHNKDIDIEIMKELISASFDVLASKFLQELNVQGRRNGLDYLFELVQILDEQLTGFQNFFAKEFQNYVSQDRELTITTYFTTNNLILQQVLIQAIRSHKLQHWKQLIDLIVKYDYYKKKEQLLLLFTGFEEKTKRKISEYIIKNSLIILFIDLFQDPDFFDPILTTTNPIEPNIYILLRNCLQRYIQGNFNEITSLGRKITYPKDEIASSLTESELKKLVLYIDFSKTLLQPWEAVFLSRYEESLPYLLNQLKLKTKKRKGPIVGVIKKIIDIENIKFWEYIGQIPVKIMSQYDSVCIYAFERSIRNLEDVILTLSEGHISYIAKKIVPKFSSEGRRMIYSLLSTSDSFLLNDPKTYELLVAIIKLDPDELVYITLLRLSKMITIPDLDSFTKQLFKIIITSYTLQVLSEVDSHSLNPLIQLIEIHVTEISDKQFFTILQKLIPTLRTECLRPILVNQTIRRFKMQTGDFSLLDKLLPIEESQAYSDEGYLFLTEISHRLTGQSAENDIKYFIYLRDLQSPVQKPFLEAYFDKISQGTLERLLNNPSLNFAGKYIVPAITKRFIDHPPTNPERYFMALFQQTKRKEIKKAVLPLLGEYCSWMNLNYLLELPEQIEYKKEYEDAVNRFAQRFNIASSQTLLKIWSSGLKDIYNKTSQSVQQPSIKQKFYQTQCPKCGNPILEKQKNCGFCSQRFTCAICLKSVVRAGIEKDSDLVECHQCSNFFHRRHLLTSVKMKPECPICHIKLTPQNVTNLPRFQFFFH